MNFRSNLCDRGIPDNVSTICLPFLMPQILVNLISVATLCFLTSTIVLDKLHLIFVLDIRHHAFSYKRMNT